MEQEIRLHQFYNIDRKSYAIIEYIDGDTFSEYVRCS